MTWHDAMTLTVGLVALCGAAAGALYVWTHWPSVKAILRLARALTKLAIALTAFLHLAGILGHGNTWFPTAVLALLVTSLAYDVVDW